MAKMKASSAQVLHAVVVALLCTHTAVGQSCSNATTTIRNAADASALAPCSTFTGVISVATDSAQVIEIDGPVQLEGSLVVANNSKLTTIASGSLETITNDLIFSNLSLLYNITFPAFQSIESLTLNAIPAPNVVTLATGSQLVNNVYITNTKLEGLNGLSLDSAQMAVLQVTDNRFLSSVVFGVGNITQSATVTNNGGNFVLTMPNLTYAYNIAVSNVSLAYMSKLSSVSQGLSFNYNQFSNLTLPSLAFVGGDFDLSDNSLMDSFYLDQLTSVNGNVNVLNNTVLSNLGGLSALSNVGGKLDLVGAFSNATLPALSSVKGDMTLESTNSGTINCSAIASGTVQGTFTCNGEGGTNTSSTSASATESHTPSKLSAGAAAGIGVGAGLVAVVLVLGIGWLVLRRRRERKAAKAAKKGAESDHLPDYQEHMQQPAEASGSSRVLGELATKETRTVGELEDNTSPTEMGRSTSRKINLGPEGRHELPLDTALRSELP